MQTGFWGANLANTKMTTKSPVGEHQPTSFHNKFSNQVFGSKKKYILLTVTLAIAGVIVFLLLSNSGNKKSLDSAKLSAKQTDSSSEQGNTSDTSVNSSSNHNGGSSSTSVKVNGQSVDVPESGSYDKTVNVPGGTVHVSGNNSSSGSSSNNSQSTNVKVNVSH